MSHGFTQNLRRGEERRGEERRGEERSGEELGKLKLEQRTALPLQTTLNLLYFIKFTKTQFKLLYIHIQCSALDKTCN
jgi:hypothetical protein